MMIMKTKKIVTIITSLIVSAALSSTFAVFNNCNNEVQKVFGMCDSEQSIEVKNELKPKRQLVNGPCWAFSAIAALEAYLVKHNMYTGSLSEKALLNWAHRGDGVGWNVSIKNGASRQVSDAYFTSGAGPVSETEVPYNVNDAFYDQNSRATPLFSVRGLKTVDSNVESIKEAVSKFGGVTVGYDVSKNSSHGVCIIGWDDKHEQWVVKDSSADSGYSRLPYSTKLFSCRAFTDVRKFDKNETIYQHDTFGIVGSFENTRSITYANAFDFKSGETLDSVMIYSDSVGADYNIYYVPVLEDGTLNSSKSSWTHLKSGKVPFNGYFTAELNNKLHVAGKGSIAVEISPCNGTKASLGFSRSNGKGLTVPAEKGKSFSYSGSKGFVDQGREGIMCAIKAITKK